MDSGLKTARLQQCFLPGIALLSFAAGLLLWRTSPLWAVLCGAAIALGYGALLAAEFIWATAVNRRADLSRAPLAQVLLAWLREMHTTPRVFGWRQPYRSLAVPDTDLAALTSGTGSRGVIFLHGFFCNRGLWSPWLRALQAAGHPFIALNLTPMFASIDNYAPQIDAAIERMTAATGQPPLLVCHSMGGLAVRAWRRWTQQQGLRREVAHIVTIATPHAGTVAAQFAHGLNGQQMRMGSAWLTELAAQEAAHTAANLAALSSTYGGFTCWSTATDNLVFPASSASLPGADNRCIAARGHVDLAFAAPILLHTLALLRDDVDGQAQVPAKPHSP